LLRPPVVGVIDPTLDAYLTAVTGGLARVLGSGLVGVYLHGSAALGGWSAEHSDVDLLGVVAHQLVRGAKRVVSARLNHPSLTCPASRGLELCLVTAAVAGGPPRRPPFELYLTTGPWPRTDLGGTTATDPGLLLQFAACRRSGLAVTGPEPVEVFAEPPRAWLLEQAAAELARAGRHGSFTDRVLAACRAWRFLEDDVLAARVESGRWARLRLADPSGQEVSPWAAPLVDAVVAAQRGRGPTPTAPADLAAADRFVAAVLERFREASA
jgi:hypothetical protein